MHSDRWVLLEFLHLYVQIKIRVKTFDANHSTTDSTQSVNRCFSPQAFLFCSHHAAYLAIDRIDVSGETISLSISMRLAVDFLYVMYITDKQFLLFNVIWDLLQTGRGSAVSSVTLFRVTWAKTDWDACLQPTPHRQTRALQFVQLDLKKSVCLRINLSCTPVTQRRSSLRALYAAVHCWARMYVTYCSEKLHQRHWYIPN